MTTISRFSRQNDAGLRALNVVLWKDLVFVLVLVLESKGPYLWSITGSLLLVTNQCILPFCIIPVSALRTFVDIDWAPNLKRWSASCNLLQLFGICLGRISQPYLLELTFQGQITLGWGGLFVRSHSFSRVFIRYICFSGMCQESTAELGLVSLLVKCLEMSSCPSLSSLATRQFRTKCILALSICVEQCGKHVLTVKVLLLTGAECSVKPAENLRRRIHSSWYFQNWFLCESPRNQITQHGMGVNIFLFDYFLSLFCGLWVISWANARDNKHSNQIFPKRGVTSTIPPKRPSLLSSHFNPIRGPFL